MMIFLAIVAVVFAVTSAVLAYRLGKSSKKNASLAEYVRGVEEERNTYRKEWNEAEFQKSILIAKLDQIDIVLKRLGADSVRVRIQPFLLSAGEKNGSR